MGESDRSLFEEYASAVAYIEVRRPDDEITVGSAFHVGAGVFITTRHVVDGGEILKVANTVVWRVPDPNGMEVDGTTGVRYRVVPPTEGRVSSGPHYHPDGQTDVAAVVVEGLRPAAIPLGGHLDDWLNDEAFQLQPVLIMGYPRVPACDEPVLVAVRAEVNAVVDPERRSHPHFIVSAIPRTGFCGGPCLFFGPEGFVLGVVTEALTDGSASAEFGFMAVLSVEPIWTCLQHYGLVPDEQKDGWEGFWD